MNNLDCNASNHSPVWGVTEFLFWKLAPKNGAEVYLMGVISKMAG